MNCCARMMTPDRQGEYVCSSIAGPRASSKASSLDLHRCFVGHSHAGKRALRVRHKLGPALFGQLRDVVPIQSRRLDPMKTPKTSLLAAMLFILAGSPALACRAT